MTTSPSKNKRVAIIYFPGRIDLKKLKKEVKSAMSSSLDWDPPIWLPTTAKKTGGPQTLQAIEENATHILVAGGDGTVRSVLETLVSENITEITVGIIPVGTGNVLARNLKIEMSSMRLAVRRGLLGNRYEIDLGLAKIIYSNGERSEMHFSVMGGMGLDARMMKNTKPKLKKSIGWMSYVESGLRSNPKLFEYIDVTVDNREPRTLKVISLLVGNIGLLPGNLSLMPDAKLDDGLLDIAAIGPRKVRNWIDLFSRITFAHRTIRPTKLGRRFLDATTNLKTLENLSGSKIRVKPEYPIHLELDGDVLGMISEVEFSVIPGAITVRV